MVGSMEQRFDPADLAASAAPLSGEDVFRGYSQIMAMRQEQQRKAAASD